MAFTIGDIDWGSAIGTAIGGWMGGQGTPDQVTSQTPYMFQGQEEGITNFLNASKEQYQAGPQQYYPGQMVAGLDPNTIAGQNAALGTVGQQNQLGGAAAQGAMNLAGGGNRVGGFQLEDQIGFGLDPGLEAAVMNPIQRQLADRLKMGNLSATSQGAFGGSRAEQIQGQSRADAQGQTADALARANLSARGQSIGQRAGDISAQLSGRSQDIQQNQLSNMATQAGLSAIPGAQQALLSGANVQQGIGGDRAAYEQALMNADKAKFDFEQQAPITSLNLLGDRMSMNMGGQTTNVQGQSGTLANILGGAYTGANIGAGFFGAPQQRLPANYSDPLGPAQYDFGTGIARPY